MVFHFNQWIIFHLFQFENASALSNDWQAPLKLIRSKVLFHMKDPLVVKLKYITSWNSIFLFQGRIVFNATEQQQSIFGGFATVWFLQKNMERQRVPYSMDVIICNAWFYKHLVCLLKHRRSAYPLITTNASTNLHRTEYKSTTYQNSISLTNNNIQMDIYRMFEESRNEKTHLEKKNQKHNFTGVFNKKDRLLTAL